jgi:hypothetical protein
LRKINPDTIWHGLCLGDPLATAWCKAYLTNRVKKSVRRVMVLEPEEFQEKRMLNCASSVLAAWRALVKEAALRSKRAQEPSPGDKWRLRFHNYNAKPPSSSIGVFEISKVSVSLSPGRSSCLSFESGFGPSWQQNMASQRISHSKNWKQQQKTLLSFFVLSGNAQRNWESIFKHALHCIPY